MAGAEGPLGRGAPSVGASLDLSLAEVKQLWWFLDGAIMSVDVRRRLRASWGFCPRHTWAFAFAECEIHWGDPVSVSVLYEDLTARAAAAVRSWARRGPVRQRLAGDGRCFTCSAAAASASRWFAPWRDRANRRRRTTELVVAAQPIWGPRSCPVCLGGRGLVCRHHLVGGFGVVDRAVADALAELAPRLDRLSHSFTVGAAPPTEDERAAWVEALGWFAGWD